MGEKIKSGGTIGRAPLGYINVRHVDEKGREDRTVVPDPERAPLIKLAFKEYAAGNWTLVDLAEHLAACGLTTRSTPKISSRPITVSALSKVLVNSYYKGVVHYKDVDYPGNHEPLVSEETWNKVQTILASKVNGERNFKHPHFLKSTVYCAYCGERLITCNEKKKNGTVYPYFVCAGRHSKRHPECKTRAVLIEVVEKKIEELYDTYQLPSEVRGMLESQVQEIIAAEREKYNEELNGLKGQKAKLENKRQKLLEAHYNNAIPIDLLKSEQQKIAKELAAIEHEIRIHNTTFEGLTENLQLSLDMIEDCGKYYRNANNTTKRLLNQAIFKKIYVSNAEDDELKIELQFRAPYDQILEPIKDELAKINRAKQTMSDRLQQFVETAKGHIQAIFGCGLNAANNSNFIENTSNQSKFFGQISSSKNILVGVTGFEPATSRISKH